MKTREPKRFSKLPPLSGITLLELLVAMAIAGMIMAVSFPSVIAGLDGIRLQTTARRVGAFINLARAAADRDQLPVEIRIEPASNRLSALSADGSWGRELKMEPGVRIAGAPAVSAPAGQEGQQGPQPVQDDAQGASWVLLPGVPAPRFSVRLVSERGRSVMVTLDPLTGVPEVGAVTQ